MRTFCGQGGFADADVRTFWCKKHQIFRNLWCVRTDKGGGVDKGFCGQVSHYRHFVDKGGGGQFLAILGRRHLWMGPLACHSDLVII